MSMAADLGRRIAEADALLIGASNGLSMAEGYNIFADNDWFRQNFGDFAARYGIRSILEGIFHPYPTLEEKWGFVSRLGRLVRLDAEPSEVMQHLRTLAEGKDVFVLTTNGDDHFGLAGFAPETVFAMEGALTEYTCSRHCTPQVWTDPAPLRRMAEAEKDGRVPADAVARCPNCGSPVEPNGAQGQDFFAAPNWRRQAAAFNDFARRSADKKSVVLDIGIGPRNQLLRQPLQQFAFMTPGAEYAVLNMDPVPVPAPLEERTTQILGDIAGSLAQMAQTAAGSRPGA